MNRKILFLVLLLIGLSACSVVEYKVVDKKGNPIKDVLFIAEKRPYVFSSWKKSLGISNEDGKVNALNRYERGLVYKQGYYPIVNLSDVPGVPVWSRKKIEREIVLFRVPAGNEKVNYEMSAENINLILDSNDDISVVEYDFFKGKVEVRYSVEEERLNVAPLNNWKLYPSKRFYFIGDQLGENKHKEVTGNRKLAFYLVAEGKKYKVLIAKLVSGKAYGNEFISLDIRVSLLSGSDSIVYPSFDDWHQYSLVAPLPEGEYPKVYVESEKSELSNKIKEYMSPSFLGFPSAFYELE